MQCKVPSLCILPSLKAARRQQELHLSIWIRGLSELNFKDKQEHTSHCLSVNAWWQAGVYNAVQSVFTLLYLKPSSLRVEAKSCVSVYELESFPNPV